jgi:hypothetical protein
MDLDVDYQHWDEQLEQDIADDKLEALAEEAIAEFKAGHCRSRRLVKNTGQFEQD